MCSKERAVATYLITFINEDEEEIESGHDGRGERDVLLQRLVPLVAPADGVGRSEDGRAGVQGGLDARLGDGDGLLFHGLVDGHLVLGVHLVELINTADTLEANTQELINTINM